MMIFAVNERTAIGIILIILFCSAGNAYGMEQVYDSDLGKIKVDLPMVLTPKGQYGSTLDLVKPGSEKPVISILIQEPFGQSFKDYAASSGYENPLETITNDGYKMDYYVYRAGTNARYEPVFKFVTFIDYLDEKGKIIQMFTYSEVHGAEGTVAKFTEAQFLEISKSFTLINESEAQAIDSKSAKTTESPGFGSFLAIACLLGVICAIRRLR